MEGSTFPVELLPSSSIVSRGITTLNMNEVKTTVKLPEFDSENINMYIDELEMWQMVSEVDKKKQALLVWLTLPKDHPSNLKQFIHDSIGKEGLNADDGMEKLVNAMKKCFAHETEIEAFMAWKKFDKVKRSEGEEMKQFVNKFNAAYNSISKKKITIPESTKAFILVNKAGITEEMERQVIHRIDFAKDTCYAKYLKVLFE